MTVKLRYLSLFSGIEAASQAWQPLGWEAVAFSEIEPFPCALLAHHYPKVPNLGDVTKITKKQIEKLGHIDLVVGGFPCQDISIAGKRRGFKNEDGTKTRSGLFYDAVKVSEWTKARWVLLENVPGLFSSKKGADFAEVVSSLSGGRFVAPEGGWKNTGCALGPQGLLEWAILDARWLRVPQRRRRAYILLDRHFGDGTGRSPLLFDREVLLRDPETRISKGKAAPKRSKANPKGANSKGEVGKENGPVCFEQRSPDGVARIVGNIAPTLNRMGGGQREPCVMQPISIQDTRNIKKAQNGIGVSTDGVAYTLDRTGAQGVVVDVYNHAIDGDVTATLTSASGGSNTSGPKVMVPIAVRTAQTSANGCGVSKDVAYTLDGANGQAVAFKVRCGCPGGGKGYLGSEGSAFTLSTTHDQDLFIGNVVRKLTPKECERLMGMKDNFTLIPYGKKGKLVGDGARYRALGNSMVTNVMRWIGEQIQRENDK